MNSKPLKILLAGGGSGGPVSPVLAVALEIKKIRPKAEFLFAGTRQGPERAMVESAKIKFVSIPAAKWRRYFSLKNIFAPLVLVAGFFKACMIVRQYKPDVIFTAGSFVGVPVAWAGKLYGAKVVIHQQDAQIGLANKLVAPWANQITTAFEETSKEFYSGSGLFGAKLKPGAEWVGNPVRPDITLSKVSAKEFFHLHDELPVLLVLGGATGAAQINDMLQKILPDLVLAHQVVHQTGKGKNNLDFSHKNYHPYELIPFEPYAAVLQAAHLVIARAGLSTIAELSALGKIAIIIPMPNTHQEENAKILVSRQAAVILTGSEVSAGNLARVINNLKFDQKRAALMSKNISELMPKEAASKLAKIVIKYADE